MTFGEALEAAKAGKRIARAGWNGKWMWVAYSPGDPGLPAEYFWSAAAADYARLRGGTARVQPYLLMKTAADEIQVGWLASQSDMLSEDWESFP